MLYEKHAHQIPEKAVSGVVNSLTYCTVYVFNFIFKKFVQTFQPKVSRGLPGSSSYTIWVNIVTDIWTIKMTKNKNLFKITAKDNENGFEMDNRMYFNTILHLCSILIQFVSVISCNP